MDTTYDGGWTTRSTRLGLVASTDPLPPTASDITISSVGGGEFLHNGNVVINATGQVTMQAGPAYIELDSQQGMSNIAIVNGLPGAITLAQGVLPGSPSIKLNQLPPSVEVSVGGPASAPSADISVSLTGVKLSYGLPGVGPSIEMGPAGLSLKFAAWSINMTVAGIELAVGPNKLSLQPQGAALNGLMLNLEAITQLSLKGLLVEESATTMLQAKGAVTMLG